MLRRVRACHQCHAPLKDSDRFCARCGSAAVVSEEGTRDPLIGRTLGGAYVVLELIGVGGMGRVYRAEHSMLGRTVAIKVVHPHLLGDEQSVARFYTEARAASRLNHPNSVGIIDFGRSENGMLYLVMEYLRGKDLAVIMQEEGPLPFERIALIMIGVLAALQEAHELGIVHRDLKPENVIVERQRGGTDLVKVVDFGLAKIAGGTTRSTSITSPGLVCGTPDYMAPEQGRGDEVDGRGDIYAMGVMLFELLSDRLPYTADTPPAVVLKHMTDPIPDPREMAPHRGIPVALADIAIRAMQKEADARFQRADEMAEALQRWQGSLRALRGGHEIVCEECGHRNPPNTRFCGDCGTRFGSMSPARAGTLPPPPPLSVPVLSSPRGVLVGRHAEVESIHRFREMANESLMRVHVVGEPGIGKTRLLAHIATTAQQAGDIVAAAGPHPSGAPVPYHAIRSMIRGLLHVDEQELRLLTSKDGIFNDSITRAGILELLEPSGLMGTAGKSRAPAVAEALAVAVGVAKMRAPNASAILIVDDLSLCDGLTKAVLAHLSHFSNRLPALLLTAGARPLSGPSADGVATLPLAPFAIEEAEEYLLGMPRTHNADDATATYLPLFVEQLRALGLGLSPDSSFPRLADAVLQRIERLDVSARRLLQAAAVLGERCPLNRLVEIMEGKELDAVDRLVSDQLISLDLDQVVIAHPYIRDVVEASIPAEARKSLHQRALLLASDSGEPLEVRAEHSFRAGELVSALVLHERMGDDASSRGDVVTAVLGYRRGLEIARQALLDTGDDGLDRAIGTFSRKLGDALEKSGDAAGADGVVREALELSGRDTIERARMLLVLGRVALRRERPRDALRLLGEGLEIATRRADRTTAGEIQGVIAEVRREEGDHLGAANALQRASELYREGGAPLAQQVLTLIELGAELSEVGDVDEASRQLDRACRMAVEADLPALAATALGTLATVDEMADRTQQAVSRYRDASLLAAKAGDAEGRDRWHRAATDRRSIF